jgi:hypothetical protein
MPMLYVIYGTDTPNEGRVKINWNFANLLSGSITGITASIFTNPNPTTKTIGGIPAGTTFVGDYYIQDLFDMLLYPAITPTFNSFTISGQGTSLEVGESVSGTKTFTWTLSSATYLKANSIDIEDTTNSSTLASSLSNDGTESISVSVTKTSPSSNVWTIYGEDVDDNVFSRTFNVNWYYRIFHGSNASVSIGSSQIQALSSTLATNDINGTYSIGAANYGYICIPSSFEIPTAFRNSSTNFPIEMAGPEEGYSSYDGLFYFSSVTLVRNTVSIPYKLYRTKQTISGSTSIILKSTGATTSHLYNQFYTGSTTLGSFLSNFTPGGGATLTGIIPGTNIQTGGTPTNVSISTVSNPSFNSLSASTYFCGTTSFDTILSAFAPQGLDSVLTVSNSASTKDIFIRNIAGGSDHTIPDWNLFSHSNILGGEFIDFGGSTGEYAMTYLGTSFCSVAGNNLGSIVNGNGISISDISDSFIIGGTANSVLTARYSGLLGGTNNSLQSTSGAFIFGGFTNVINGFYSTDPNFYEDALILAGYNNTINNGSSNLIAVSSNSTIFHPSGDTSDSFIVASDTVNIDSSNTSSIVSSLSSTISGGSISSIFSSQNSNINSVFGTAIIAGISINATENHSLYTSNLRAETAIFSAGTNLNQLFVHKVIAGTNIVTGGTRQNPTISVSSTPSFASVFATNISGSTLISGNTNISNIFLNTGSTYIRSISGDGYTNISVTGTQDIVLALNAKPKIRSSRLLDSSLVNYLEITLAENVTTSCFLYLKINDADRTIDLAGDLNVASGGSTVSGINTGDQNLTPYLHSSGGTITGSTSFQTLSAQTYFSGSTPLTTIIQNIASSYSGGSSQLTVSSAFTNTYNIQLSDPFNLKILSSSTFINIIIPTNASVAIPIGSQIMFKQGGVGQLRFSGATGVTMHSYGNAYNHVGQYSTSFLTKESSDLWVLDGNLTTLSL